MKEIEKIANPFGGPVLYEESLSSTMDAARVLAGQGAPHGTVITADFQEAGRGRIGRQWNARRGESLFFTLLLRYADYAAVPKALTLKTGLAVSQGIETFMQTRGLSLKEAVQVKWPNDIMIGPQKTAGILTEGDGKTVYIGIGVNLTQTEFPEELRKKAVSIALACREGSCSLSANDRFPLLETVLAGLFPVITEPDQGQWRTILLERLYMRNKPVRFLSGAPDSGAVIEGVLQGIGPQGELLIVPHNRTEPVSCITGELDVYLNRE